MVIETPSDRRVGCDGSSDERSEGGERARREEKESSEDSAVLVSYQLHENEADHSQ